MMNDKLKGKDVHCNSQIVSCLTWLCSGLQKLAVYLFHGLCLFTVYVLKLLFMFSYCLRLITVYLCLCLGTVYVMHQFVSYFLPS